MATSLHNSFRFSFIFIVTFFIVSSEVSKHYEVEAKSFDSLTNQNSKTAFNIRGTSKRELNPERKKVTICHVPPGEPSNFHTITVGEAALPAHLSHGDSVGPCDCEALCNDGNQCTIDCSQSGDECMPEPRPEVDCDDQVPCTRDECHEEYGCINRPDDTLCSAGEICHPSQNCISPWRIVDEDGKVEAIKNPNTGQVDVVSTYGESIIQGYNYIASLACVEVTDHFCVPKGDSCSDPDDCCSNMPEDCELPQCLRTAHHGSCEISSDGVRFYDIIGHVKRIGMAGIVEVDPNRQYAGYFDGSTCRFSEACSDSASGCQSSVCCAQACPTCTDAYSCIGGYLDTHPFFMPAGTKVQFQLKGGAFWDWFEIGMVLYHGTSPYTPESSTVFSAGDCSSLNENEVAVESRVIRGSSPGLKDENAPVPWPYKDYEFVVPCDGTYYMAFYTGSYDYGGPWVGFVGGGLEIKDFHVEYPA